jgi:hypothetical protein
VTNQPQRTEIRNDNNTGLAAYAHAYLDMLVKQFYPASTAFEKRTDETGEYEVIVIIWHHTEDPAILARHFRIAQSLVAAGGQPKHRTD